MSAALLQQLPNLKAQILSPVERKEVAAPKQKQSVAFQATRLILFMAFASALIVALSPELRATARSMMLKDYRTVLSTVSGDLRANGHVLTIVKVKTRDALSLEVYEPNQDGSQKLLQRIKLPDTKDGYFSFNGEAANLAIDDVDGSGSLALLAPSFDQNLVGHLNAYRFDPATQDFQQILR